MPRRKPGFILAFTLSLQNLQDLQGDSLKVNSGKIMSCDLFDDEFGVGYRNRDRGAGHKSTFNYLESQLVFDFVL